MTALANGLSLGRIHHAYLFPVPAGSGRPPSPAEPAHELSGLSP
ncbi:DNA polymerase III subunit gamma/tau [Enterobacter hormaechei]|nr:DNA polymerase III subunit gamma/tau [Enterobacter hormaechei]